MAPYQRCLFIHVRGLGDSKNQPGDLRHWGNFCSPTGTATRAECVSFNRIGDGHVYFRNLDRLQTPENLQRNAAFTNVTFATSITTETALTAGNQLILWLKFDSRLVPQRIFTHDYRCRTGGLSCAVRLRVDCVIPIVRNQLPKSITG
jgi:hypothetical protein